MVAAARVPLLEMLRGDEVLCGTFLGLGSALAAEACALSGFDWLLVDLEHGAGGETGLVGQLLAAAAHDIPVLVRVETGSRIRIGRALDLGAAGVMFPRVTTADEVETLIRYLRYPPEGERGVATYNRACSFGLRPEAIDEANATRLAVVQIETLAALDDVEAIARVPGVNVLFVGPRDLSHAMGIPGQVGADEFKHALLRVVAAASAAGITAGVLAGDATAARGYAEMGFRFIGVGSDSTFIVQGAQAAVEALRIVAGRPTS